MPEQLDLEQYFVRPADPRTSVDAAIQASRASRKAVEATRRLMADHKSRTDQQIRTNCRAGVNLPEPFVGSLSLFQHARLALVTAGVLVDTGTTGTTEDGCESRVWKMP